MPFANLYCRAGGSNMNGGGLATGLEPPTTPVFAATGGGWTVGTGVYVPPSGNPLAAGVAVGDFANVFTDGSTTPVFIGLVTARDATTITVSLAQKSGTAPVGTTGISINVGGAWSGPAGVVTFPFGFVANTMTNVATHPPWVNLKNDQMYSIVAAGALTQATAVSFGGYTSTARDGGKAIIDGTIVGTNYVLLTFSGTLTCFLQDLIFQNNGTTGTVGNAVVIAASMTATRVVVRSVRGMGLVIPNTATAYRCEFYGCNTGNGSNMGGVSVGGRAIRCFAHSNTGSQTSGFIVADGACIDCIADSNGPFGFNITGTTGLIERCVAWNNTSHGVSLGSGRGNVVSNCIIGKNTLWGINGGATAAGLLINNAFGGGAGVGANGSGNINPVSLPVVEIGSIQLAGNPFVDSVNGDFRLSDAAAKGTGDGLFTQIAPGYAGTISYPDCGAVQHLESAPAPGGGGGGLLQSGIGSIGLGAPGIG